jgi:hypothetical protein
VPWQAKFGHGHVNAIAFSPFDGKTLAIGTQRMRAGKPGGEIMLLPVADLPTGESR